MGRRADAEAGGDPVRPTTFFADAADFRAWLEAHHESADELWMELRKRHVPDRGLTWADAVPVALCFGWIDSANQPVDDDRRRQRWTPRRRGSTWSAVNVAHVERLRAEGLMTPAGEAAFADRSPGRTAIYTYERELAELTPEQLARIAAVPRAAALWAAAAPGYRRSVAGWVLGAKREETRERRLEQLIADSADGRLVPPFRPGGEPAWLRRARAAQADL